MKLVTDQQRQHMIRRINNIEAILLRRATKKYDDSDKPVQQLNWSKLLLDGKIKIRSKQQLAKLFKRCSPYTYPGDLSTRVTAIFSGMEKIWNTKYPPNKPKQQNTKLLALVKKIKTKATQLRDEIILGDDAKDFIKMLHELEEMII